MYRIHGEIVFDTLGHRDTARTAFVQRWGTDPAITRRYAIAGVESLKRPRLDVGGEVSTVDEALAIRQWVIDELTEHPVARTWIVGVWIKVHRTDRPTKAESDYREYRRGASTGD